jgi:Zn/Cd-binding protein ZinT
LRNDKSVIIQERFNIISEFRVEIVAGRVLGGRSTVDRYAYMYLKNGKFDSSYKAPDKKDLKAAEAYAKEVASSLPPELQNMTFGLDIAIIEGGEAVMIESNPGGNSNFLYEEEISNVKKLTQFLLKFPELIKTGKIHIGWTPKEQMEFLKRKFSDWRIETESLYPGMKFLEDKIVDSEFKKNNSVKLEKKTPILKLSKPKVFKCEAIFLN